MVLEFAEIYVDESGTHRGAKTVSVAAYIGSDSQWATFEGRWRKQLAKAKIECFRASRPQCDRLRPALVRAIHETKLIGIVCSLDVAEFRENASPQFRGLLGNPYAICAIYCIHQLCEWVRDLVDDAPVVVVIERGQPNARFVVRTISDLWLGRPSSMVVAVSLAAKQEFVQLQAADLLAHVRATEDKVWLRRLKRYKSQKRLHDLTLSASELAQLSAHVKQIINFNRNRRRQARREAKKY
jgi:hypothetical protein